MPSMLGNRRGRPLLALLAGGSLCATALAAGSPLEQAKDQLKRMRVHLSATSNRFKGGMKIARPSEAPGRPVTPALECCEANLRALQRRFADFDRAVLELAVCYRAQQDAEGLARIDVLRTDAGNVRRGLDAFVNAPTRGDAEMAMGGTTRSFLALDKDVQALAPCEPPEPDYPTSDPSDP